MTTVSFVTCCKDEQEQLPGLIRSLPRNFFEEKICLLDVDTKDLDLAQKIAHCHFDRVHLVRFADSFGELVQLATRLCAPAEYAFWMDCDERVSSSELLAGLWMHHERNNHFGSRPAFKVARARWTDWMKTKRVDADNHDWQIRIVPTTGPARFIRRCHIALEGVEVHAFSTAHIIDHFHDVVKGSAALLEREKLYVKLCELEQVSVEGGHPLWWPCACGHTRASHLGTSSYATPPYRCMVCGDGCTGFEHKE